MMRTIRLTIAYDGTAYAGWQRQPDEPTIQQTLEAAIEKVTGRHSSTVASGRTDAGVHAQGQVVAFRTESKLTPEVFVRALNANLPQDIAVLDAVEIADGFRPTHDAKRKRYRYLIHDGPVRDVFLRHYAWHYVYGRLDVEAMQRAAIALLGRHDFSSFESSGAERATSIRTVFDLTIERGGASDGRAFTAREGRDSNLPSPACGRGAGGEGRAGELNLIILEIEADGFLYNMVRTIVGTLVQVGSGAKPEHWPAEVLLAADRRVAGPTAPPQGLCLMKVEYEKNETTDKHG